MFKAHSLTPLLLMAGLLTAPRCAAQAPYVRIGAAFLAAGGQHWGYEKGPDGREYGNDTGPLIDVSHLDPMVHRFEAGYEWPLGSHFGARAGATVLRIYKNDFGWKQVFLDLTWAPWAREEVRPYVTAGVGVGSFKGTYAVRKEEWDENPATAEDYLPGEYHAMAQNGRPFLRASLGIRLNRHFGLEIYGDGVSLHRKDGDPWASTAFNSGLSLILRLPNR